MIASIGMFLISWLWRQPMTIKVYALETVLELFLACLGPAKFVSSRENKQQKVIRIDEKFNLNRWHPP